MLLLNNHPKHNEPLETADATALSPEAARDVIDYFRTREGYSPTPLVSLPGLARALDVGEIWLKDEGHRLGLGSFKALGGAYAVVRLAQRHAEKALGRAVALGEVGKGDVRQAASSLTVACATDGNHGRSVAQGAQLVGASCVIFVHARVSQRRIDAIAAFGAEVIRVNGNYDESVAEATRVSIENGWVVVSDTSWPGYEDIPRSVMQGYTALLLEAQEQIPAPPTHVFVQAGVGGIAAAAAAYFDCSYAADRPFFTVVDPSRAACLYESAKAGRPVVVEHTDTTVMAMLECYEPSMIAWDILSRKADAFMTVDDEDAIATMRRLARPVGGDPVVVSGESGGVGLAALIKVANSPDLRHSTNLTSESRVFLINTEGATDLEIYSRYVEEGATAL